MIPKKYDKKKKFSLDKLCEAASSQLLNEDHQKTLEKQNNTIGSKYPNEENQSIPTEFKNFPDDVERGLAIDTKNPISSNFPKELFMNYANPVEQETFDKNTLVCPPQLTQNLLQQLSSQLSPNSSTFTLNSSISSTLSNSLGKLNENKLVDNKAEQNLKYECHFCGKFCSKPSILQKHLRTHTNERPYSCSECSMKFKTKSNLSKHYKSKTHQIQTESNKHIDVEHDENYATVCSNNTFNRNENSKQQSFQESQSPSNMPNPYSSLDKILSSPLTSQNNVSKSNLDIKTQSQVLAPPYMPVAFKLIPNNTPYSFILQPPIMTETHSNSTCSLKSEQMLLNSSSENFAALYNLNSKQKDFYLNDSQKASKINKLKQNSEKNEQKEKKIGFNSKDISERISEIISKNNSIILDMPKIDKPRSKKVVRAYSDNKPTPPKIDTVLRASSLTPTQSSETSIPSDPRQLINNSFLFNTSNSTDGDDFKQSIVTQTQQTNKNVSDSQNHPNLYLLVSNPNHLISINSNLLVSHSSTHTTSKLIQPLNVTSNSSTPSMNDYGSLQSSPINVSTHMNQQNLLLKSKSFCDLFNLFNADEVPNVLQKHVLVKSQSESQNPTLIHQFDFRDMNENLKLSSIQAIGEGQMNNNNSFGPNNIYHQTSQNHIFKKQGDSLLSDRQMVVSKDQNDNQDKNVLLSSLNKLLLKSDKNKCHELKNYNKSLASMSAAPSTLTPNLTFNNPSSVGFLISQSFCTSSNELKNILLNSSEISHSNENNSFIKSDTTSLTTSSIKRAGRPKGSKNKKQSGLSKNNNQSIPAIKISYADNCFKEIDSKIELKKHILMKRSLSNENENKIGNGGRNSSLDLNETSEKSSFVNISKNKNNIIFDAKLKAMKNVCSNGFGNVSQEKLRYQQSSFSTCSGDSGSFLKQTLSTTCDLGVEESCNQNIKSQEHDLMNVFSGNVLNTVKNPNLHATSVFNHTKSSLPTTKLFRTPTTFSINDENPNRTLDQLKNLTDANNKKLNSKPINLLETQNFNDNTFEMEKKLQSERKYQLSIPIKKRRKTLTELGRGTTFGTTVDDNIDALNKTSSMLNKTKPLWRSAGSPNKQFIECAAVEGSEQSINSIENNVTERNDKLKVKNSSEFNRTCESFSDGNTTSNITNSINNISNHKCGIIEDNSLKRKIIDSLNLKNDGSSVGTSLNSLSTLTKNAAFNSDDSNKNTISNLVTYLHTNTNETQEISELQKNYCISTSFELKALPKGIDSSSNYSVPMSLSDDTEAAASLLDLSKSLHVLTQSDQGFCRQALIDSIQTSNSLTKTFSSRLPSSFSSSSVLSSLIQQQSTSFNNLLSSILTPVTSPAALTAQSTLNSSNHGVATGTNNGAYNTVPSLLASTISTNNYFMHKESYQCQICNEAFNKVSSLRTHTLLHSLDKPYKCVKCSVSFNNRWQFNRHNKSKHHFYASFFDSRPFKCIPCRKAFRIKGHLSKHKRSNQHKISKKNYDEMIAVKNQGPLDDVNEDKNHKRDVRVIDNLHDKPYTKGEYSSFKYSFKNTIKEKNQNAHENSQNIYSNVVINSQTTETFARSKETNTLGDILISGQKLIRNLNEADRQDGFISLNDDNDKNSSTSNMTSQTNHKINAKETNKDGYIGKKSKIKKIFKKSFDQSVDDKTYRKGRLTHQHSIDFDDIVGHDDNLSSLTKDAGVKRINGSVDDSKFISRKKLKINNGFLFKTHPAVKDGFPIDVEARVSLIGALRQTFKTCTMNDKFEGFKISTSSSAPNLISLDSANNISIEFTDTGSKGIFTTDTGVLYSHVNSGFHANTQQKLLQTLLQSSSKQDHTNNPLIPSQHKDYSSFTSASSTHDNASLNSTLEKPLSNASMKAGSNFVVVSLQESFTQQALQPDSVIKCRWCHLICASLNALMDHIEEHIERKVHECSVCKGGFENKQSLFNHQHLHNLQQHSQAINGFVKEINAIDDRGNNGVVNESTTTNDEDTENNFDGELKIDTGSSENDCDGEESTITESECSEEKSKITIGNIQSIISGCILNEETHDTNVNIV